MFNGKNFKMRLPCGDFETELLRVSNPGNLGCSMHSTASPVEPLDRRQAARETSSRLATTRAATATRYLPAMLILVIGLASTIITSLVLRERDRERARLSYKQEVTQISAALSSGFRVPL